MVETCTVAEAAQHLEQRLLAWGQQHRLHSDGREQAASDAVQHLVHPLVVCIRLLLESLRLSFLWICAVNDGIPMRKMGP